MQPATYFTLYCFLVIGCCSSICYAFSDWQFNNKIYVSSKNSAGQLTISKLGFDSVLLVDFQMKTETSKFDMIIYNNDIDNNGNQTTAVEGISFVFIGNKVNSSIDSVKLTYQFPEVIDNVVPNSMEVMVSDDDRWHSLSGKKISSSLSFEIDRATFTKSPNDYTIGIFCNLLPKQVSLGERIEIYGPRSLDITGTQKGKLHISFPDQPIQTNAGFITFEQEQVKDIAKYLPSNLNPKLSFSFTTLNVNLTTMNFEFESEIDFTKSTPIQKLFCLCSSSTFISVLKLTTINSRTYSCFGSISQCSRISISSPIPMKLAPGNTISNYQPNQYFPFVFANFVDILPETPYSMEFRGTTKVSFSLLTKPLVSKYLLESPVTDLIFTNPSIYYMTIDMSGAEWMRITLSNPLKILPIDKFETLQNETQLQNTQIIGVSSGLGASIIINLIFLAITGVMGFIIYINRHSYLTIEENSKP